MKRPKFLEGVDLKNRTATAVFSRDSAVDLGIDICVYGVQPCSIARASASPQPSGSFVVSDISTRYQAEQELKCLIN